MTLQMLPEQCEVTLLAETLQGPLSGRLNILLTRRRLTMSGRVRAAS